MEVQKRKARWWNSGVTRAYILALTSILFLGLGAQLLTRRSLDRQADINHLVHGAATFRVIGLRIMTDALALDDVHGADRTKKLQQLEKNLDVWRCLRLDVDRSSFTVFSRSVFPYQLAAIFSRISFAGKKAIQAAGKDYEERADAELARTILASQARYDTLTDALVKSLVASSEYRPPLTQDFQIAFLILALIVVTAEFRYIVAPRMRKLSSNVARMENQRAEAALLTQQYHDENEKLKADHAILKEITSNLASVNQRIESAARRFEELFQGLPIACFGYDESGRVFEWNRACEQLFGAGASFMFAMDIYSLLSPGKRSKKVTRAVTSVFEGQPIADLPIEVMIGKNPKYLLCSTFPVHGQDDRVSGAIFVCVDLTAQKQYERQIKEQLQRINEYSETIEQKKTELEEANTRLASLASTDGLTGLHNHRAFQEALARDCRRALRDKAPLSIILMDLDHFKSYNDSFGHPAGDQLLKHFSAVLMQICRQSDLVARYGGEEFVVILPATDAEGAFQLAERVRFAVEHEPWDNRRVTVSIGVATLAAEDCESSRLIRLADQALYLSKSKGRNRVTACDATIDQAA